MAKYFKTPFSIDGQHYYVEVNVPRVETAGNNIICCVDVSGSMSGAPIRGVCQVLKNIYEKTQTEYPLFTYNTTAQTNQTIKCVANQELEASGGTNFSAIFTAIQNHLIANQKSVTFIFMTDGQDTTSQATLKQAMQRLKLTINGLSKTISITFHVIGFGDVNNQFLDQVRKLGTKEGLFRYSTQSSELENDFNDMFEYAISSREFTLNINEKLFTSSSNEEIVSFLIDQVEINSSTATEVKLKSNEGESTITLELMKNVSPLRVARALNLLYPESEESVQAIRSFLNSIVSKPGTEFMEKLELEQIKKEIDNRMIEFKKLLTQIKMGQVPEQVKLRLSALRHDATFANAQRRKVLDLRISKNVDYFRKTDISGILEGYRKSIDQQGWNKIKEQTADWICTYSNEDIYDLMRKTSDNILCWGILVERSEEAITSPTKGLKLVSVSNTLISYDSFIRAMTYARNNAADIQADGTNSYGNFEGINNSYCVVGQLNEKINAVIPLYINDEHMKRIRILEGIWLGYLFTLDSYGYDKQQEIGLLKLLCDIISLRTGTTRNQQMITEFEKVCHFIITESIGFKSAYGEQTYPNYLESIHGRQNGNYDLCIPLMIGYLNKDLTSALIPVYYEHLRRCLHKNKSIDRRTITNRLLYGDENQIRKTVASNEHQSQFEIYRDDPDYVEKSFIEYFHDEQCQPIELVSETKTGEDRKLVLNEPDIEYIKSLLQSIDSQVSLSVPNFIKDLLKYTKMEDSYIEKCLDYSDLRKELLMILSYDTVPANINKTNVLKILDERIQGRDQNFLSMINLSLENIRAIAYKILTAKTLEGFGGLMRKYCPRRCGPIFNRIIKELLDSSDSNTDQDRTKAILIKEKLIALLSNEIEITPLYKGEMATLCWQPLADVDLNRLADIVGKEKFKQIEKKNLGQRVLHCYRVSNKANRHGYSNYNPNMNNTYPFTGYHDRH